jgi:hypothetical protein
MAELWFSVLTRALLRRGEFTSRADLIDKITGLTIRCNRTARPWKWARADHAGYLARRAQHDSSPATSPATARAASMKPAPRTPQGLRSHMKRPVKSLQLLSLVPAGYCSGLVLGALGFVWGFRACRSEPMP